MKVRKSGKYAGKIKSSSSEHVNACTQKAIRFFSTKYKIFEVLAKWSLM